MMTAIINIAQATSSTVYDGYLWNDAQRASKRLSQSLPAT
nr:MAG TPA: hypothetical protein [Caudoviricetes sp.]